jgi:hypothetical protein
VLTGGQGGNGDVWEWNGSAWTFAGNAPALDRTWPAVWFDPSLAQVVVAGGRQASLGRLTDAIGWNGAVATPVHGQRAPLQGSFVGAFAWSPGDGRPMLHGGDIANQPITDSWTWDGNAWQSRSFGIAPPPRWLPATAPDNNHGRLLLYGGMDAVQLFGDLWSWDGVNWTPLPYSSSPPPRTFAGFAYDEARNRAVLFGGQDALGAPLADTWEWTGGGWIRRSTATMPSARYAPAMAFDAGRARTVLFGGTDAQLQQSVETWEWDGSLWLQVATPVMPAASPDPAMAYDRSRGRIVLVEAQQLASPTGTTFDQGLWDYDGATWTLVDRRNTTGVARIAYDERRARIVAYDHVLLREWSTIVAALASYGSGCGAPLALCTRTRARLGNPAFGLEVGEAPPGGAVLFGLGGAQANQGIGGGCQLLLGAPLASVLQFAGAGGNAVQPVSLPALPVLRGLTLFAQAGAIHPVSGALSLSRGLRVTVGD